MKIKRFALLCISISVLFTLACANGLSKPGQKPGNEYIVVSLTGSMKTIYLLGDKELDFSDLKIAIDNGQEPQYIDVDETMISGDYDLNEVGEYNIVISYNNESFIVTISVVEPEIESIELSFPEGYSFEYYRGDVLDLFNIELIIKYVNGYRVDMPLSDDMLGDYDMTVVGEQTVTVNYGGKQTSFEITVNELAISEVDLINTGFDMDFMQYDDPDFTGLELHIVFDRNESEVLPVTESMVMNFNTWITGSKTFTVSFHGYTFDIPYNVIALPDSEAESKFIFTPDDFGGYSIAPQDDVTLPSEFILPRVHDGKFVTSVADNAFSGGEFEKIEIFGKLVYIGKGAFKGGKLREINLDNVEIIDEEAFMNCTALERVDAENLRTVNRSAFENCSVINHIEFGEDLESIGERAFYGASSLKTLYLNHVSEIKRSAFAYCSSLVKAEFKNIEKLGNAVFAYCEQLEDVVLPEGLQEVGDAVFMNCSALVKIKLPASALSLGEGIFYNCRLLEDVDFPDIVELPAYTFVACSSLKIVSLPESVEKIGDYSFVDCVLLSSPDTSRLKEIGQAAFRGCIGMESIKIPASCRLGKAVFENWLPSQSVEFEITEEEASGFFDPLWQTGCEARIIWKI